MPNFFLEIKRAQTPFYRALKHTALLLLTMRVPIPRFLKPVLRGMYHFHRTMNRALKRLYIFMYGEPLFRSRCESLGRGTALWSIPEVQGDVRIHIGDHVSIWGTIVIASGSAFEAPRLIIGNRVQIGHQVTFYVNKEIIVEDGVMIANGCYIFDHDGHPRQANARVSGLSVRPADVKPVRIRKNAWIGTGCSICKGSTIGEGAIIGTRSVVMGNIPDNAVALGNPAKVLYTLPTADSLK